MSQHISMGAGHTAPQRTVAAVEDGADTSITASSPRTSLGRGLLAVAAAAAPVFFTAYVAINPAPLPREPAADFLGAIAAHPTAFLVSTTLQFAAAITGIAFAAYIIVAFARTAPRLAPVVGVLLGISYLAVASFVGAKLVAADLVVDGALRTGSLEVWSAVRTGPFFDVMDWPILMAIPANLLLAVLLVRSRALVGVWPAVLVAVGFVMGSGEFPDAVTVLGWAIQIPAIFHVVRRTLRG
jgi:hypothetical protein